MRRTLAVTASTVALAFGGVACQDGDDPTLQDPREEGGTLDDTAVDGSGDAGTTGEDDQDLGPDGGMEPREYEDTDVDGGGDG